MPQLPRLRRVRLYGPRPIGDLGVGPTGQITLAPYLALLSVPVVLSRNGCPACRSRLLLILVLAILVRSARLLARDGS